MYVIDALLKELVDKDIIKHFIILLGDNAYVLDIMNKPISKKKQLTEIVGYI